MGGGAGGRVVELGGVEGKAKGGLDAGAEGLGVAEDEDTGVVDLGLDKGGVVKVSLGADLERDTAGGRLGVVDGLGAGLDVLRDLVVVRGREGREVAETVEGDGVLGGREADGTSVAGDGTRSDVVRGLGTNKETVVADNGVGGEGGALRIHVSACFYRVFSVGCVPQVRVKQDARAWQRHGDTVTTAQETVFLAVMTGRDTQLYIINNNSP